MLDNNGVRQLAYVAKIGWVRPIEGADNIELVGVNGWSCIAKIGEFKEGDLCVYFEIDSKLPEKEWSEFLAPKHYKVKTMKLNRFKVISQGLALPFSAFGWEADKYNEGDFLTEVLGVTYSVEEDNKRKAPSMDKYKKMAARHPEVFKKPFIKWLYNRNWGKKLLFLFYGKKKDGSTWPAWVVKTDEERIQNMPWILEDKDKWFATEKIDGTSTTFTMKGWGRKREFYVCSRNVVFDKPDKGCYYDTNVYTEMAEKYNMEHILSCLMEYFENIKGNISFITVQGETYGATIQKRDYGMKGRDLCVFNVILGFNDGSTRRLNPREMELLLSEYNIPTVPIVEEGYVLPDTVEELLAFATGASAIDGGMREGLVFRSYDGAKSFKAVSNEFLLKYHQ